MSEKPSRFPIRFCPSCGERAGSGAKFCMACGVRLASGGAAAAGGASDARAQRLGLLVFGGFLTLGLVLWVTILQPQASGRLPIAQKPGGAGAAAQAGANAGANAGLPSDHPPIDVPAEVKTFIADLEKKAAEAPRDAVAWRQLAQVEYRAGQIDRQYLTKAEASYRHLLELDPKDLEAIRGLGNVHFDHDDYPKAIESYTRYLVLKPEDASVRTDLGTMFLYSGQEDKAIGEYRKALAGDPKFYQAHFNLGIAYAKKGDAAKATEAFTKAKALAPDDKTRAQIQAMMERSTAEGRETAEAAATPTFQGIIEQSLRTHQIVGPKVFTFEWPTPTRGRVLLDGFPMEAMPDTVRSKFLERLRGQLADARQETAASGVASLELVDRASGKVMATVTSD